MKIIRIKADNLEHAVGEALSALKKGGLAVIPTDTVYGLAAMPDNAESIKRLFAAKKRDTGKPVAMLASGWSVLARNKITLSRQEKSLARKFWPGPLTLVLKAGRRREGIRVPDSSIARQLIKKAGGLLRVTSANISGKSPALTAGMAVKELGDKVDVYIDAGRAKIGKASTVVQIRRGRPVILREGAVPERDIIETLRIS